MNQQQLRNFKRNVKDTPSVLLAERIALRSDTIRNYATAVARDFGNPSVLDVLQALEMEIKLMVIESAELCNGK
jgi:hypothetical protein